MRECPIISTENFIARHIIHGKQTCIMPSAAELALFARLRRFCVCPNKLCCACYTGVVFYG